MIVMVILLVGSIGDDTGDGTGNNGWTGSNYSSCHTWSCLWSMLWCLVTAAVLFFRTLTWTFCSAAAGRLTHTPVTTHTWRCSKLTWGLFHLVQFQVVRVTEQMLISSSQSSSGPVTTVRWISWRSGSKGDFNWTWFNKSAVRTVDHPDPL